MIYQTKPDPSWMSKTCWTQKSISPPKPYWWQVYHCGKTCPRKRPGLHPFPPVDVVIWPSPIPSPRFAKQKFWVSSNKNWNKKPCAWSRTIQKLTSKGFYVSMKVHLIQVVWKLTCLTPEFGCVPACSRGAQPNSNVPSNNSNSNLWWEYEGKLSIFHH